MAFVPGWHTSPWGPFGGLGLVVLALLFLPIFVVLTRAAISEEAAVDKPNRVRQWYGYIVCLIAVITGLLTVTGALNNAFDLSSPLAAEGPFDQSLTSFDSYMATRTPRYLPPDQRSEQDTASSATLHARYEALRADRITQRTFAARKGLVTDLIVLVIAIALFTSHWRWLRKLPESNGSGRAA